jgi:hypothetical protein
MPPEKVSSPFVGLVPYTEDQAQFFFGRERDQQRILANLFASRLTILYGASGVGKSSVLRAGVIREVKQRIEAAKEAHETPGAALVFFKDWKGDFLPVLRGSIDAAVKEQVGADVVSKLPASATLKEVILDIAKRFGGDLLLIFDQFEEYFLYHPNAAADAFAHQLAEAANQSGLPAGFLLSLRDDAVARLDRFKALIPSLFSNYLRLQHLSGNDAVNAIVKPVERYKKLAPEHRSVDWDIEVEDGLPQMVIEQVHTGRVLVGQVGKGQVADGAAAAQGALAIETPYLQIVMTRLWRAEVEQRSRTLRCATLKALGGAEAIVKGHLEGALKDLTDVERGYCAAMFPHLVTPSGSKIAHTLPNLAKFAKVEPAVLEPLLETLSKKRILSPSALVAGETEQTQYEIYHDSLGQAVLSWQTAYEAVRDRAARDKEKHRVLVYAVAFAMLFLLAAGCAAVAAVQWRIAQGLRAQAEEAEKRAVLGEKAAISLKYEADAARDRANLAEAERNHNRDLAEHLKSQISMAQSQAETFKRLAGSSGGPKAPSLVEVLKENDELKRQLYNKGPMQMAK